MVKALRHPREWWLQFSVRGWSLGLFISWKVVVLALNKVEMKAITINASEQEIWEWKARAVSERKRLGEWVRGRLNEELARRRTEKPETRRVEEIKQPEEIRKPDKQKGVEVDIMEPKEVGNANTVEGAKERLKEMEGKKAARMNTGESEAEFVKRQEGATKAMEKRYGK